MTVKQVEIRLIVDVDITDDFTCHTGDPVTSNCVLNLIEDFQERDAWYSPVKVLEVKEISGDS
tara:strand:+ start:991 stop:1179 length:189 start_codon:yes stop_codon:yes gene_type:complete